MNIQMCFEKCYSQQGHKHMFVGEEENCVGTLQFLRDAHAPPNSLVKEATVDDRLLNVSFPRRSFAMAIKASAEFLYLTPERL